MIEKIVKEYLELYIDVPVYLEIPADPDEMYVAIERTSGGEENYIESATLAIKSVSFKSLYNAAELNEQVKKAMRNIVNETKIMKCKLNTDYNFTDTVTKAYRYQAVFNINY